MFMTTVSVKIISVHYFRQVVIMIHSCTTCCSLGFLSVGVYAVRWVITKLLQMITELCWLFQLKVKICKIFLLS
jgi:hypothetical protein